MSSEGLGVYAEEPHTLADRHRVEQGEVKILMDTHGADEQLWALREAFAESVPLPSDASVIGEFERMLWLNPTDNQGVRDVLPAVRADEGSRLATI